MKQKALRAGDAHSHEDEECRKRSTLRFGRCLTSATGAQQRARLENVLRHILSYFFAAIGKTDIKLRFSIFENDNKVFYDKSRKSQILKTIKSRKTIKTVGGNKNG